MQANRQKIGIFIIVIALIIIILILYFVFSKKNSNLGVETPVTPGTSGQLSETMTAGTTTPSDAPRNYQQYDITNEPTHKVNANDLGKISMSFAERFGSFSNQSNYGNFVDLKILMTDSMKTWADKYVDNLKAQVVNNTAYYGVTTKALTYEVKKFDDSAGQAEILITTQRRESDKTINGGDPYIQKLSLSLVKVSGEWLFDKAYWENK